MNKENIIPIVEEYLEHRRTKLVEVNSFYVNKIIEIGVEEEVAKNILLKMDDQWSQEEFALLKLKNLKLTLFFGYALGLLALVLTVLSFLGIIFGGQVNIFFYGAIASGLVTGILAQGSTSKIKHELSIRKYVWKSWI